MTTATADEVDVEAQRDELLRLYSTRRLSPAKAAERVGVPVEVARAVRREWAESIDDDLPVNYAQRRRELACVLLVHLAGYTTRAAGLLLGMQIADVERVVDGELEAGLAVLLRRHPVGPAFLAHVNGLAADSA